MTEQNLRTRTDLESHDSRKSEGTAMNSRVTQLNFAIDRDQLCSTRISLKSSVVQDMMFGMNRQEAMIESLKAEIRSVQRDLQSTQNSLTVGTKWTSVRPKM